MIIKTSDVRDILSGHWIVSLDATALLTSKDAPEFSGELLRTNQLAIYDPDNAEVYPIQVARADDGTWLPILDAFSLPMPYGEFRKDLLLKK